jgi:hypothetical protein
MDRTEQIEFFIMIFATIKKEICEEIHKKRKSLNDHLDQLQQTLIGSINRTVDDMTLQLGDVKNSLIEIGNKTSDIALEFIKIKEHASDLQTFLHISFFRVRISCIFFSLSSVSLLTKEPSSLRVCSRSNIAGADLKFGRKSFNGATRKLIVNLLNFRLKVWQHRTSLMKSFAHYATLHQLKQ